MPPNTSIAEMQIKRGGASNTSVSWQAPEYPYRERGTDWFWAVGVIFVALAVIAFIYNNVLFAIFILLGGLTLFIYAIKKPRSVHFEVNEKGVIFDTSFYPYSTLESFWIEEDEEEPKILIKSKKLLMPYIIVPMGEADSQKVNECLSKHLPEEEHEEPLSHKIMEFLGF